MATNNSDYNLPFTDLFSYMTDNLKTDVNKYVSANVFNRFLSKAEPTFVLGTVGQRLTTSLQVNPDGSYTYHDTRLPEIDVFRQAWQLEPVLYTKLATVEKIMNWQDVEAELANTGIDITRIPIWGNALKFNWIPPIDLDKLVNYTNYYWYDPGGSQPDYFTIKNICRVFEARYNVLNAYVQQQLITPTITPAELQARIDQLSALQAERDCACNGGSIGWDIANWDDNPLDWWIQIGNIGSALDPTHVNGGLIPGGGWTTANPPPAPRGILFPSDTNYWWDLSTSVFKIWSVPLLQWIPTATIPGIGVYPWDFSLGCAPQTDPWSRTNFWYNRLDLPTINGAIQAKRPIIEYNPYLELNEWTYSKPNWLYRPNFVASFAVSTTEPTLEEIAIRYPVIGVDFTNNTITIAGDFTATFVPGFQFSTEDEFYVVHHWTTVSSALNVTNTVIQILELPLQVSGIFSPVALTGNTISTVSIDDDRTLELNANDIITIQGSTNGIDGNYTVLNAIYNIIFNRTEITVTVPFTAVPVNGTVIHTDKLAPFVVTSKGDPYIGFVNQWVLDSISSPIPVNTQPLNPNPDSTDYLVLTTTQTLFSLATPKHFMANTDAIRVYINGGRQYGNFEEGVAVLSRVTGLGGSWTIRGNHASEFAPGDVFSIIGNSGTGNGTYTIASAVNVGLNTTLTIIITETVPAGSTADGLFTSDSSLYYTDIQFFDPVTQFFTVTLAIGPAAASDVGYDGINHDGLLVRTTLNPVFTPEYRNLIHYRRVEQIKEGTNVYPLFDLFNIDGTTANIANEIFRYVENATYPVDSIIGRRVAVLNAGRDFQFEQLLLTPSGGMYAFKDLSSVTFENPEGLQTIWRKGLNNEQTIPQFVNQYRLINGETFTDWQNQTQTAVVNASNGTWQLPDQMFFNPQHENRATVNFSDIFTHFTSIINDQPDPTGFEFVTSQNFRLLLDVNYGLGGTIHEYNDSFDTFLSAIYDSTTNPQSLFDFAESQYVNAIDSLREIFLRNIISYMENVTPEFISNLSNSIIETVINDYEENSSNNILYGDTTAYNPATGQGVKNWIATIPVLNLSPRVQPFILNDPNIGLNNVVVHHDGHMATYVIEPQQVQVIVSVVIGQTGGIRSAIRPNYTQIGVGLYWQSTVTNEVQRFTAISVGPTTPAISSPIGSFWFNTTTNTLFFRDATNFLTGWTEVYATDPFKVGKIDAAWVTINLNDIVTDLIFTTEQMLYDVSPTGPVVFDYTTQLGLSIPAEQITFQDYMREEYYNYLVVNSLSPFTTDFVLTDPFTWNYLSVSTGVVVYPTAATAAAKPWAARYYDINSQIFGTAYPHLEPWYIQGYNAQPSWWEATYAFAPQDESFTNTAVTITPTNTIQVAVNPPTYWITGMKVVFSIQNGAAPGGLTNGATYYIIRVDSTHVKLASSTANAYSGTPITLTSTGLGTFHITFDRHWTKTMWDNIMLGIVPAGQLLPDGITISTGAPAETVPYAFVSVNIYSNTIDGYDPDDLIPPYYSNDPLLVAQALIRSSSFIPFGHIGDMYNFGDDGPTEKQWRDSAQFRYDILKVSYRMQPVRFLHYTWGELYTIVAGLQVDTRSSKVFAHQDTVFHGDDINNVTYQSPGINQWYIDFIRFGAYDINLSDFKPRWTGWTPLLAYLASSMIDARTLKVDNQFYKVTKNSDYFVTIKKSPGVANFPLDLLSVTTQEVGRFTVFNNSKVPTGGGDDWQFSVAIPSPISRSISYYGLKQYAVTVSGDTFTLTSGTLPLATPETPDQNLTWTVGTPVYIKSIGGTDPTPLDEVTAYYLIPLSSTTFKLASTPNNAAVGLAIPLLSTGSGTITISQIISTFAAFNGKFTTHIWYQYATDTRIINDVLPPFLITGVQNLVDFVYGYAGFAADMGYVFNDPSVSEVNIQSNRMVSWQFEIENMINTIYTGLGEVTSTLLDIEMGKKNTISFVEVGPFKNAIWFSPPAGIVSNVSTGPFPDIRTSPAIYDQNGNIIPKNDIVVLREDKLTRVFMPTPVGSDYDINGVVTIGNPNQNETHIGGLKLFIDEFEHAIIFNDYTKNNELIYDPFLGMNTAKFTLAFERISEITFRPVAGGFFLSNNTMVPNFETTVDQIRLFYDTNLVNENADFVPYARALVGYIPPAYLDQLQGVTDKSKFLFWKGLIKAKGTITAINAFTNARLFVGAEVDEFWARKIATYGDSRPKIFPEIKLFTTDVVKNEIRFQFTTPEDPLVDTFEEIIVSDINRWYNQPDQAAAILPSSLNGNFYFDAQISDKLAKPNIITAHGDNFIKLNSPADDVNITFDNGTGKFTLPPSAPPPGPFTFTVSFTYILNAENVDVYKSSSTTPTIDPVLLKVGTGPDDYQEGPLNNEITLNSAPIGTDIITVQKRVGVLTEGIHYVRINAVVVQLLLTAPELASLNDYTVYSLNLYKKPMSPILVIDYLAGVVLDRVPLWDPARGYHYYESLQSINIQLNTDPAKYTNNLDVDIVNYDPTHLWNGEQAGTTWLDTSTLGYTTYYDNKVMDENTRIFFWGRLADWSTINVYQWVESDIPPSQWDAQVLSDANDLSIPNDDKHTGTPLKRLYVRYQNTLTNVWGPWIELDNPPFQEYDMAIVGTTQVLPITEFDTTVGDSINVYINGFFSEAATVTETTDVTTLPDTILNVVTISVPLNPFDTVRLIKPLPDLTNAQQFANSTNTSTSVQYQSDYPYSIVNTVDNQGIVSATKYYFWVQGKQSAAEGKDLSVFSAAQQMKTLPIPFMFCQDLNKFNTPEQLANRLEKQSQENQGFIDVTPAWYSQIIIKGIGGNTIEENNRYKIRFSKDLTLRDTLENSISKKNVHEEWEMLRQNQDEVIPRDLWDAVTESMVGFLLSDPSIPVPAVNREFYDAQFGTSTRWGLGEGQAFTSGTLAVNTTIGEIDDESFDINPIDRDVFFSIFSFDTPANIIAAMDAIYTTFPPKTTNRIWFSNLMDALSLQTQFAGLFKTSYVAIHGIKLLATAALAGND